ncbi:solute carrier family 15 member 5 [Sigmodon hispidus]
MAGSHQVQETHISIIQGKAIMAVTDFIVTDEKLTLHGGPEQQKAVKHFGCFQVGICLFLVELCEKFTFFEVVCNMIPFCTVKLGYHSHQAAILNLCFIGASVLIPVFVGWLADHYFGRNRLVYISLLLHFLGTALLSILAFPLEDLYGGSYPVVKNMPAEERAGVFHTALLTLCLGTGGIRAGICLLDAYSPQEYESKKSVSFFNWASWCMNLNTAAVFLGISCIQHSEAGAIVVLLPSVSAFMALVALYMRHCDLICQPEKSCIHVIAGLVTLSCTVTASETSLRSRNCLALKKHCHPRRNGTTWSDHAVEKRGGRRSELQEEDTEIVFSILLLLSFQLVYRMCLMQIPSGYYLQTMNSNRTLGGFPLPIALMNVINILPLLILAPFMDYFSNSLLPSERDGPFLSACIIVGNGCTALSVAIAGFLEVYRKFTQEQSPSGKDVSDTSLACGFLIPQYVLLGVSEVLVNPAGKGISPLILPAHYLSPRITVNKIHKPNPV